ncbi:MAG: helix-turn-helix domain-containing protein [Bacteroidota bacterium]
MGEEFLTVKQVAIELERSEKRIREYCRGGRLGMKFGRQWLITRSELEAFKLIPRKHGAPFKNDEEE